MRGKLKIIALSAAALLAMALGAAPAGAKTKTTTYSSGVVNIPIPDSTDATGPGHITSSIPVADKGTIKDVNFAIRITHTFDADLDITTHKGEAWVDLSTDVGGSGNDFGTGTPDCNGQFTLFDDSAPAAIFDSEAPFAGSFRPDVSAYGHSLSQYKGQKSNGTWTLSVSDDAGADIGTLHCWQMTIKRTVQK